jgi:hypothetical protein
MVDKHQSWSQHLSRLRKAGRSKTRSNDFDPEIQVEAPSKVQEILVAAPPKVQIVFNKKEKSISRDHHPSAGRYPASPVKEDALDNVFNTVEAYACNGHEARAFTYSHRGRVTLDRYSSIAPRTGPDALDMVFDIVEGYVCNSDATSRVKRKKAMPKVFDQPDWYEVSDKYDQTSEDIRPDEEEKTEKKTLRSKTWTLKKVGKSETRGAVADRIKALEANASTTGENSHPPSPRQNSYRPSNRPVIGERKATVNADEKPPSSPAMKKAKKTLPTHVLCRIGKESQQDHIKALEAIASTTGVKSLLSSARQNSYRPSIRPVKGERKAVVNADEKPPQSPAMKKAKETLPTQVAMATLPTQVVCTIGKESQQETTGLSFVSYYEKEGVFVSKIKPGSKFEGTGLKQGMKIILINGNPCPARVKNVIQIVKDAKCILEITAMADNSIEVVGVEELPVKKQAKIHSSPKVSTREKASVEPEPRRSDESAGFTITNEGSAAEEKEWLGLGFADRFFKTIGCIQQDAIDEDALYKPSIFSGDETIADQTIETDCVSVVSRDDRNIDTDQKSVVSRVHKEVDSDDKSESNLQVPYSKTYTRSRTVHAKVTKSKRRDKLGISFVSFKKRPGVYIYEIYEDSIFQDTMLEPGMKVLYINGESCPDRVSETLAMVKAIQGDLVISAIAPSEDEGKALGNKRELTDANTSKKKDGNVKSRQERRTHHQDKVQTLRSVGAGTRRQYVPSEYREDHRNMYRPKESKGRMVGIIRTWFDPKENRR